MNLQEAFEKGKTEYENRNASKIGTLAIKQPEDLQNVDNDSVTKIFIYHEFLGELPCFKDYPNLEEVFVSSKYQVSDLNGQNLSKLKYLSVFADYSEPRIAFDADNLKELYLNIQNNTYSNQISLFGNARPVIDLRNLNSLEKLTLSHVKGCEIVWPEYARSIKQLIIDDGEFSDYDFLDGFPNVEKLSLTSCNISDCSFLQKLEHLTVLNLSYNNIKTMIKPKSELSFLDLRRNDIEDQNVYFFADEVLVSDRDELIRSFKDNICRWFMYTSYSSVVSMRKPDSKRPEWHQKMIATKTDEELFSHMLSVNVSHHIAGILDPSGYQNRRAKLTYEELEKIAVDMLPFIELHRYRIEKTRGYKRYIKIE